MIIKYLNFLKFKFLISIALLFLILFIGWKGVNYIIGNDEFKKIKSIIPEKHQLFIKKYFFVDKFTRDLEKKYKIKENDILNNILKSQFTFNKKTATDLSKIRKKIIKNHILDEEQILIESYNNLEEFLQINFPEILNDVKGTKFEISIASYYELKSHALLFKSEKNCLDKDKNLIIVIAGHNGSRKILNELGSSILNNILSKCNDFLILDMSIVGMNAINWKDDLMSKNYQNNDTFFPGYKSKNSMIHHKVFSLFEDNKYPKKKPLSLMLTGNYYLVKRIIDNKSYNKILMFGKSGGAWETLFLAAIIPEIDKSISFAGGTMPLIYRVNNNLIHYEDKEKNFFNKYSYIDLFLLATYDKDFVVNRKNYHIFNLTDPCCYTGKEILEHFRKSFQAKNFFIKFFRSDKHEINKQILLDILNINN